MATAIAMDSSVIQACWNTSPANFSLPLANAAQGVLVAIRAPGAVSVFSGAPI